MELLWSAEDYLALLEHPEPEVRTWAAERLVAQHPLRSVEPLLARPESVGWQPLFSLADVLTDAGSVAWGEALVSAIPQVPLPVAAVWLEPLVRCGHPRVDEALEALLPRLEALELFPLRNALTRLSASDSEVARAYLRGLARSPRPVALAAREALAGMGLAGELEGVIGSAGPEAALDAFCAATGADNWLDAMRERRSLFGGSALERLAKEYGISLRLSEPTRELLRRSSEVRAWLAPLQAELRTWIAEDGGELERWRSAEPLDGWRWLAAGALTLLQALQLRAEQGQFVSDKSGDQLLTLLLELGSGRDEDALLAGEGERPERVLAALTSSQMLLADRIEDEAAALGSAALPALEAALRNEGSYWGAVRAARVIGRIALRELDACVSAAPALVEAFKRDEGDDLFDAATTALERIGPRKLPLLLQEFANPEDEHSYVWLADMGEIPTAESLRAALAYLETAARAEGYLSRTVIDGADVLGDFGRPEAIPFLRAAMQRSGKKVGIDPLLTLLLLHAPDDPLIPTCRRLIAEREKLWERSMKDFWRKTTRPEPAEPRRAARRDKLSRQERKKRAANRKQSRRKKGGKKR